MTWCCNQISITMPASPIRTLGLSERWRSKMKALIAALVLLSLAAGSVFAQSPTLRSGGYGPYYRVQPGADPNLWTTSREGLVDAH
jgi:hypothetical protein